MTEQWHGEYGWVECRSELKGLSVKFTPTSFTFQDDYSEVSSYSCSVTAIADIDGHYREGGRFQELGLEGDYYLTFYPQWDNREDEIGWFWEYILVSETELIIPEARNGMYKMKKTAGYTDMKNESDYLMISPYRSICYGIWQVTEELGEPCQSVNIGDTLETSGTSNSFLFCRILDKNEKSVYEIAELIGIGNGNKYLIYCKFSADYFWDYMIIKDGMEAQINLALQEPLRTLIEDGVWEDRENQQKIFDSTKIYIAYQTKQWLSVVYSMQIPIDPDPRWRDGVRDLGITINIQGGNGERERFLH